MPKEKVVEEGLHPNPGPQQQSEETEEVTMECVNITSMEKNIHALMGRVDKNGRTAFQEDKMKPKDIKRTKEMFKEAKLTMECSPCDPNTATPSAGVGMLAQSNITFVRAEKKTDAFRRVFEAGRADKFCIDLGWEQNLLCFVIYGQSGGGNEEREETEAIAEAIEEEIGEDSSMPIIIEGDFNREPKELETFRRLIEDKAWQDLGTIASWWGGVDNENTCQTRPEAKATRIDAILVNSVAIPMVKSFSVIKDDMIPTHRVLRTTLVRKTLQEERTFIKTLPSLKKLLR